MAKRTVEVAQVAYLRLAWVSLPLLWCASAVGAPVIAVRDPTGALGRTCAPVCARARLTPELLAASAAHRLTVNDSRNAAPAQFEPDVPGSAAGRVWWLMHRGGPGTRTFTLRVATAAPDAMMRAAMDPDGHVRVTEGDRPVLRYVARTIEPGPVAAQVTEANRIYARARSGYIHPLYGPGSVELTKDWSLDHPHHRGIYWAWPEVDWRGQRGDLHALQRVFSRPAGQPKLTSGPVFADVRAPNTWRWDDRTGIVREVAVIRAFRSGPWGRHIDLRFEMRAANDEVLLARRGAALYGGLNMRLAAMQGQQIVWHSDMPGAQPRMAWQAHGGRFGGAGVPVTICTFQHAGNPHYPGAWVKYPDLNWSQPTFPTAGHRYGLLRDGPLTLRYRLWVRPGPLPTEEDAADVWNAFHAVVSAAPAQRARPVATRREGGAE